MSRLRAFTLLELLGAVLLGALIMLMIAGGLTTAIRSWNAVQERVGTNYNRRSVLDLLKRQSSSLFFSKDVPETNQTRGGIVPNKSKGARVVTRRGNTGKNNTPQRRPNQGGIDLPAGTHWFAGNIQELNFISTVSFLSDFPGPVAVRYYVVQGNPGEDESIVDLPNSRSTFVDDDVVDEEDLDFSFEDGNLMEPLEGGLYLYVEEKNLFLFNTNEDAMGSNDPFSNIDQEDEDSETPIRDPSSFSVDEDGFVGSSEGDDLSQVYATSNMRLIGPLRTFTIRYRNSGFRQNVDDFDDEEAWAESWNSGYPVAVEFTLVFEPEGDPDRAAEIPIENLDAFRMVLPIYETGKMNEQGVWDGTGGEGEGRGEGRGEGLINDVR